MWPFKRRAPGAAPEPCDFCGRPGEFGATYRTFRDVHGEVKARSCLPCSNGFPAFESRLAYVSAAGHSPWLAPDPDSERLLATGPDPYAAVDSVVRAVMKGVEPVAAANARLLAVKNGTYGVSDPERHGSRDEALATISAEIAGNLEEHHASLLEHGLGEYRITGVATFGRAAGLLFQTITTEGDWLRQTCFMIDTGHGVHSYLNYDR
ncbi:hypothetical protein [Spirillospora sp. CA-294931]|uniref:hypothetical protein n=1 Tax=Spirillospora sp. CA-294931 TaxID=3240042 RepID=UPI003D8F62AA